MVQILLSRINCFLQRSPYPIGSRTGEQVDGEIPDLRDTPAFKRLDADTVAFRLSFPRDLRHAFESDGSDTNIETNLILAHQVAHTATILLHEVWCTTELNDPSMQRCMQSASAILRYLSHKTASRTARLNPFIAFVRLVHLRVTSNAERKHSVGPSQAALSFDKRPSLIIRRMK